MSFIQNIADPMTRYELQALQKSLPGIVLQVLGSIIQQTTFEFSRGTTLPTPPQQYAIFILNRQASSLGDIEYHCLQKSNGDWAWFQIIKAA